MQVRHRAYPAALLVLSVLVSGVAAGLVGADTPEPPNATMPCHINLVGTTGGTADAAGEFSIVVRDFANNPMAGSVVSVFFAECADLRIAAVQPFPGLTVDCGATVGTVTGITNGDGIVEFRIVGGARNLSGGAPGAGFRCARVYADGVLLGTVNVGAFDQNGAGGVNPVDVSLWLGDIFSGSYFGRSDYDCSGTLSPVDLSRLLSASLSGGSMASAASYCH